MRFMKELCQRYGFHPDACAFLDDAYKKLEAAPESLKVFEEQVEVYRQDHLFAHMPVLERLHSLAREVGLHQDTLDLLYMIRLLPILQELYKKEGLDDDMFFGFVKNIQASQGGGKEFYGLSTAWWFMDFYKLKLFTIGRLQYRYRRIKEDTPWCGRVLKANTYYIDVHIPGGGPLLPELCQDSYDRAAAYFRRRYQLDEVIFGCYSWLLSPDLDDILPPTSNILAFGHQYTLAEAVPDTEYSHLTFAFGVRGVPEDLNALPEKTSLHRVLKPWLLKGNILRLGKGYFIHKQP